MDGRVAVDYCADVLLELFLAGGSAAEDGEEVSGYFVGVAGVFFVGASGVR